MRRDIKGKHCDDSTAEGLKRYWEGRKRDLEILYDNSWERSNEDIANWLENVQGHSLEYPTDFNTMDDYRDYLQEKLQEEQANYGLSIDVVEPCTFKDQPEMYLRYQFSWGGPSDEIRFYFDESGSLTGAEYWYLDWGTGCYIDITDLPLTEQIWDDLKDIFYEQINDALERVRNIGCDAYMDCDKESIPEECQWEEEEEEEEW